MSSSNRPVSVFIVEDDAVTRQSLVRKVNEAVGFSVFGSAATLESARRQLISATPNVLLVDLQLPDGDGSELIAEFTARSPQVPILVISVFGDESSVVRAIGAGAQGYLLKDAPGEDLADALEQVIAGQSPISPGIAKHLIRRFQAKSEADTVIDPDLNAARTLLSSRELEILHLASKGLSNKESAQALGISVNTIGTYTRRVYTKLAVSSRAEALFEARQLGLIDDRH